MHVFGTILLSATLLTSHPTTEQANISVLIKNLTTDEVIDSHREDKVVPPASVMKLLTTGSALEILGEDFRFPTVLEYSGAIRHDTLFGNLYVRGGCDPSLGAKGKTEFLSQWTRAVKSVGIKAIEGAVVADMTMLDGEAQNPNWLCEDVGNYYAPSIFSLNYYSNTMNVVLKSGEPGTVASVVKTEPKVEDIIFINHIRCDRIQYDGAFIHGLPYSNERYLTGSVPSNLGTFGVKGDLPNPGLLLARHLKKSLEDAGVPVKKEATFLSDYNPLAPPRIEIDTHYSEPLKELVKETNVNSNNLYAESIFRYLGTRRGLPGTVHNSQDALKEFWKGKNVNVQNAIIKDGCGLAPQDAISAKALVELLTYMYNSPHKEAWIESLPISGQTGTLKSLCAETPLDGRIHAKSGSIAGTKNFAGYIDMPNGDVWVFAVLVNSAPGKAKNIQKIIQEYLLDVYQQYQ